MDIDSLWGATLVAVELDVTAHRLRLRAEVTRDDQRETHDLLLEEITDVAFHSGIEPPWSYAEMTEVRVEPAAGRAARLSIILWSEEASLSVTSPRITLDGQPLPPT